MEYSPFDDLPPEVRNRIWDITVSKAGQVRIRHPVPAWKKDKYIQPAITRVCKQTRDECLLMFYARNTFVIEMDIHSDWSLHCERTWEQLRKARSWLRRTKPE